VLVGVEGPLKPEEREGAHGLWEKGRRDEGGREGGRVGEGVLHPKAQRGRSSQKRGGREEGSGGGREGEEKLPFRGTVGNR